PRAGAPGSEIAHRGTPLRGVDLLRSVGTRSVVQRLGDPCHIGLPIPCDATCSRSWLGDRSSWHASPRRRPLAFGWDTLGDSTARRSVPHWAANPLRRNVLALLARRSLIVARLSEASTSCVRLGHAR